MNIELNEKTRNYMLYDEKILLSQTLTINEVFNIKQFIIKNSSQFPIYVNTAGGFPSNSNYEFSIQPNCDFSSSVIDSHMLFIYTPATDFKNPATITLYDIKKTEPSNTPYLSNQSVNSVSGYPVDITMIQIGSSGIYSALLPNITFDTPTPVYFLFGKKILSTPFIITDFLSNIPIGGVHRSYYDGIIYYSPSVLNSPVSLNLFSISAAQPNIQLFSSPNLIFGKNNRGTYNQQLPQTISISNDYSYVAPPAFYMDFILNNPNSPSAVNYNITIQISLIDLQANVNVIYNQNFIGTITTNTAKLINDFFTITSGYRFVKIDISINAVLSSVLNYTYNIFNY